MIKITYKHIAILILIFAFLLLIMLINTGPINYMKMIGISISINLISTIIIIYLIDFKKDDDENKMIEEKRKIMYGMLIDSIMRFDEFVLNMYKSVATYDEMKEFEYSIKNIDFLIKKIYLIDTTKCTVKYNRNLNKRIWKEEMFMQIISFLKYIDNFYEKNSFYLTNDLTENINIILKANYYIPLFSFVLQYNVHVEAKDLLELYDFKNVLIATFNIKNEISQYYDNNPFEIDKSRLLDEKIPPYFGSAIK